MNNLPPPHIHTRSSVPMSFLSRLFKPKAPANIFEGYIDHHTHILPGVDDGFKTVEDSLHCLSLYEKYGFAELWLTPHIMEDVPNATGDLRRKYEELSQAYDGPIKLHLASENMLDSLFVKRLDNNDLLPMGDHLLVETSYFTPPSGLYEFLEQITHHGYYPLLAHPERYRYMDDSDYRRLIDTGVKLQLNLFSLVGAYGREAREKAMTLLKKGYYSLSGTDIHHSKQVEALNAINREHKLTQQLIEKTLLHSAVLTT